MINLNTLFVAVNDMENNFILKSYNREDELVEEGSRLFSDTYCSLVVRQKDQHLIIPRTASHPFTKEMKVTSEVGNITFVGVPITLKDGTNVGTICGMDRKTYVFSKSEIDLMKSMSKLLAYVIELEYTIFRDSLTLVFNRRYLDVFFEDNIHRKYDSIGLLFFDFDNFKTVNDLYDHQVGDQVLKEMVKKIKQNLGPKDILIRIGGDEFLALILNYKQDDVLTKLVTQIQQSLRQPVKTTAGEISISSSIGISRYPYDGTTINDLVKKADRAMYEIKYKGKNDYLFYRDPV